MEQITIRSLQHFLYCKHRWGLIEIEKAWAENAFVVKANIDHERAHSKGTYTSRGKEVYTELDVWNDEYGIYGKLDCLELHNGRYTIVEYKPTQPGDRLYHREDALQIYAQKLCVDKDMNCDCEAVVYYADTKKRVRIPFEEVGDEYKNLLLEVLAEMRSYIVKGRIPPIPEGQRCSGCSMRDMCMPSARKKASPVRARIIKALEDECL